MGYTRQDCGGKGWSLEGTWGVGQGKTGVGDAMQDAGDGGWDFKAVDCTAQT